MLAPPFNKVLALLALAKPYAHVNAPLVIAFKKKIAKMKPPSCTKRIP